ncbi:acetyl-CoA synthetase-like protein [Aspergillus taichungensis]|uniref:Acetyl-CoA synthetase-like protein n=1 Tax=Aspergillus taichungensis TaxID=482145 RepID=A0A2J5I848_9EURO|nr:acetyl-CoA synthetase-like protein [Aspergillus taichungensis]
MLCQLRHFVYLITTSAATYVTDLGGISPEGLDLVARWNGQEPPAPTSTLIWPLIQRQCREQPQALAIDAWDGRLTYSQLEEQATAVAARLLEAGFQPDQFAALLLDKSMLTTVVVLGVIKAGGAFLLLDAAHPLRRLRHMCQSIGAVLVVASSSHADVAAQLGVPVLSAGRISAPESPPDAAAPQTPAVQPHHALYAGFTSGSTGDPKGFIITQTAFASGVEAYNAAVGLDPQSRVFQFASYSFMVSIINQLAPLACGACLCVPSQKQLENDIAGAMRELRATWVTLTPSVARTLHPDTVPALRTLVMVGEPLCRADLHRWRHVTMYSAYGQSEHAKASIVARKIDGDEPSHLGHPYCARGWVVDRDDPHRLVPVGAEGELVVEGPCLARGYLDGAQTQEAFLVNPPWLPSVRSRTEARFFLTGDMVRQHPEDGSLQLVGRKGARVKIRGQRVELGEVEHQLSLLMPTAHAVVADIVCAADDPEGRTPMLVAFVQLRPTPGASEGGILVPPTAAFRHRANLVQRRLQEVLPGFMIPAAVVEVSSAPRTPSGKVHRSRLRECAAARTRRQLLEYTVLRAAHRDAESDAEATLQQVCAQVLGRPAGHVGLHDSFLDLGGDSLTARRVVSLARSEGLVVSLAHLLQQSTLAAAASHATGPPKSSGMSKSDTDAFGPLRDDFLAHLPPSLAADEVQDVYPALELQAAYASRQVVDCFPLHLTGALDVARLRQACQALIQQHAILRTVFHSFQRQLLQVVRRHLEVPFVVHQCASAGDAARWAEAFGAAEMAKRYAIDQPIIGFVLVQACRDQHHILIMRLSHGQYDALCIRPLIHGLWNAYRNEPIPQQSEFKAHVQRCFQGRTAHAYAIWREMLEGAPLPSLPLARPPHDGREATLAVFTRELPPVDPLPGTTQATMVKAAWLETLRQETGREDVVFGQFVHGWTGTDGVMGPCMNVVPVRMNCRPDWTQRQLLQAIQSQHAQTTDSHTMGWQDIVAHCTDWPGETRPDSVVLHNSFDRHVEVRVSDNLVCRKALPVLSSWPVFPVLLVTRPGEGKMDALLLVSTDFGVQRDADRMLDRFAVALRRLEEDTESLMPVG